MHTHVSVVDVKVWDSLINMIKVAGEERCTVRGNLNGVVILVNGDSVPGHIYREQQRIQSGYATGEVGPYPKSELTAEETASDAKIKAEKEERIQNVWKALYVADACAKHKAVIAKLSRAPAIELTSESAWQRLKDRKRDNYSGTVFIYAERWARLMQYEMLEGKGLEDVANITSHEANFEDVSDFEYMGAVSVLAACWKHGQQFRAWHELKTKIGSMDEKVSRFGNVLNPEPLSSR